MGVDTNNPISYLPQERKVDNNGAERVAVSSLISLLIQNREILFYLSTKQNASSPSFLASISIG